MYLLVHDCERRLIVLQILFTGFWRGGWGPPVTPRSETITGSTVLPNLAFFKTNLPLIIETGYFDLDSGEVIP
jgi:hypothetical protein